MNFQDKSLTKREIDKIFDEIMENQENKTLMDFETFRTFTSYPKDKLWLKQQNCLNFKN